MSRRKVAHRNSRCLGFNVLVGIHDEEVGAAADEEDGEE